MSENAEQQGEVRGAASPAFHEGDQDNGATTLPVWNSTGFRYSSAEEMEKVFDGRAPGFVYSRIANPTLAQLERRLCLLENGSASISFASGMAAISSVILGLASAGDEIVSSSSIFGGTYSLFSRTLDRLGITTKFVDPYDLSALESAISDKVRAIFIESMGNPALDIPDIQKIAEVAARHGVALIVDNTVATPELFKPLDSGADIVIESTSKYINGTGTAIGGMMVDAGRFNWGNGRYPHLTEASGKFGGMAFAASLRQGVFRDLGACFNPGSAFLMSTGLDTLRVRMERHCGNAATLANVLSEKGFEGVNYPALKKHRDHDVAEKQFGGLFGGIMTLRLGSKEAAFKFINGLKVAMIVANIGDARTLAIHPASTFCREFDAETRLAMGVTEDLVRLSVGLEDQGALIDDIVGALEISNSL